MLVIIQFHSKIHGPYNIKQLEMFCVLHVYSGDVSTQLALMEYFQYLCNAAQNGQNVYSLLHLHHLYHLFIEHQLSHIFNMA
jgi:hypothetical protein